MSKSAHSVSVVWRGRLRAALATAAGSRQQMRGEMRVTTGDDVAGMY
jgi:hypothetical protein